MGSLEIVIQDYTGLDYIHDQMHHVSYGVVHAVLLCFDISSPESFENIEHKVRTCRIESPELSLTISSGIMKPIYT